MRRQDIESLPLSLRRQIKPPISLSLWGLSILLMGLAMLLRGRGIHAMPLLGEEATALRLAATLHDHGLSRQWIAALGGQSPILPWLLAQIHLNADPLLSARFLSTIIGTLLLPLSLLLWANLGRLLREPSPADASPGTIGLIAALLLLVSPYLATTQRIATNESLFVTQTLAIAWLSLRLGLGYLDGLSLRYMLLRALPLGLLLALALLTAGPIAWPLFALAPAALLAAHWRIAPTRNSPAAALNSAGAALLLAFLLWFGWWRAVASAPTLAIHAPSLEPFTPPGFSQTLRNFTSLFIPLAQGRLSSGVHTILDSGWYPAYFTPPVFILAALALPWLLARRERPVILFLGVWLAATIGPLLFFMPASALSRYGAAGAVPLLLAAAFIFIDMISTIATSNRPAALRAMFCLLIAITALGWPAITTHRQTLDWHQESGIAADITHNSAAATSGVATRGAYLFLLRRSVDQPMVVLLPAAPGNPSDGLWLLLTQWKHRQNHTELDVADLADIKDLPPPASPTYQLCPDKYASPTPQTYRVPKGAQVLLVLPVHTPAGPLPPDPLNEDRGEVIGVFANGNDAHGDQPNDYVRVYLLK